MSTVLAIDPGNELSAFALIDADTCRPLQVDKVDNVYLSECLQLTGLSGPQPDVVAIEMVASYGMPVGREVFETCVWIGRFLELTGGQAQLVYRKDVKLHHCHSTKAKDSNITQALVDRFAHNMPNKGKGTKAAPGWFYGFHRDIWQAYALAVQVADTMGAKA